MLLEWKYCFKQDTAALELLQLVLTKKETGQFMGSTYLDAWSHTCFSLEQCRTFESFLRNFQGKYISRRYARGNLFDSDFHINTFDQAYVQWCPSPIYCETFQQKIPPFEPWGISMEGRVLLARRHEQLVADHISGLRKVVTLGDFTPFFALRVWTLKLWPQKASRVC
jgi:hypothetical protein